MLGELRVPRSGFNIGSGLAPGACSLLAAWREARLLERFTAEARTLIARYVVAMRWIDDVFLMRARKVPVVVAAYLRLLTEERFFGDSLKLEKEEEKDVVDPFGF